MRPILVSVGDIKHDANVRKRISPKETLTSVDDPE